MPASAFPAVGQLAPRAIILAYRENTDALEAALRAEGFEVAVQRAVYTAEELTYSRTIRCLLNHRDAWQKAARSDACTLIVESDFVPCRGLATLPAPFDPARHGPLAWAFLYAGGPRIIWAREDGALEGHACCSVAMLVSPAAAAVLLRFVAHTTTGHDLTVHSLWDTRFQWWAMGEGARCFLPYRHYGEHGGIANPEHIDSRVGWTRHVPALARSELFNNHHAECLAGPLRFLPPYARGSRTRFLAQRLVARLIGWARLMLGRVAAPAAELDAAARRRIRWIAFRRLLG